MNSRVSIGLFLLVAAQMACACVNGHSVVSIPLEVQFASPDYRQEWIYLSLNPRILLSNGVSTSAHEAHMVEGSFQMEFCVDEVALQEAKEFRLELASSTKVISTRPIEWHESGAARNGRMAMIRLLEQPDPNWVAMRSIRMIPEAGEKGALLLELTVVNFSSVESSHDTLVLRAGGGPAPVHCMESHEEYQETYLNLSRTSSASKTGDSWTMLGESKVDVPVSITSACGYYDSMSASIPIQTQIAPGSTVRIVLKLLSGKSGRPARERSMRSLLGVKEEDPGETVTDEMSERALDFYWLRWHRLSASLVGTDTYPRSIVLEPDEAQINRWYKALRGK